jgi:outer membrane receptor protein involved in Fe transport
MKRSLLLAWIIFFISMPFIVFCQSRQVTGTVTTEKGSPLPLASVIEEGTKNGTTTNERGAFTLNVSSASPVLVISYSGMQTQELQVGSGNDYNVSMSSTGTLSEVVVTALGISREKKALGYATQDVKAADLNRNHQSNLVNALQGKVAGVTISSIGGGPGQGSSIRVRGINSIDVTQSNEPLFVIDGIILDNSTSTLGASTGNTFGVRSVGNRASDINPEDIETINVLKGSAATALYGLHAGIGNDQHRAGT